MHLSRRELGALGEKIALDFLTKHGLTVLERKFRCREEEIDLAAEQWDCLVFVDVHTKATPNVCTLQESVTPAKGQKLLALAKTYLLSYKGLPTQWRIDMVANDRHHQGRLRQRELIENDISED